MEAAADRVSGTYQRRKAANACLVCRKRKTKCDNELPVCGFCKATGGDCQYERPKELRYDQASIAILQRLDSLEKNLGSLITTGDSTQTSGDIRAADVDGAEAASQGSQQWFPEPDANAESPPSSATLLVASSDMSIESLLQLPVFKRHLPLLAESTPSQQMEVTGFAEPPPRDCDLDLRQDTVRRLVENFIKNNLPSNPIVEPQSLRAKAQVILERGPSYDGDSCLVV